MKHPMRSRPVKTVGGLIKQLQRFPSRLPVRGPFGESVQVVVYNYSKPARDLLLDKHCEIEPI